MHIALFGGTFDPPHLAHQAIARYLITHHYTDQVWYVPVYQHPWADKLGKTNLTPYHHRLNMIQLLAEPDIVVAEYPGISFTYPTIKHFHKQHPTHTFSWVMGSEYLPKFHLFIADHPQLIQIPILIYPRASHPLKPTYPNMTLLHQAPLVTISSTHIRSTISRGKAADQYLPQPVIDYITTHQLYQPKPDTIQI